MGVSSMVNEVLNNSLGIVIVFNDKGEVSFLNQVGIEELGYQPEESDIAGMAATVFRELNNYVADAKAFEGKKIKTTIYRKNNTCFPAVIRIKRIENENHEMLNVVSVLNITDEHLMENELQKVREEMSNTMRIQNEFTANITHELRTPVNGIQGHIKNLILNEEDEDKRKVMDIIMKCCLNMEKIINNLLDFSKIEAGKFELASEEFSVRQCIEHVISTSSSIANEKGIQLSAYVDDAVPETIIGDELRLVQMLNNLISNAVKFTSVGYVRVEVYQTFRKKDIVELSFLVIDTGIGISSAEQDKLFQSFSQVDGSVTRKYGGTGLGLYVTKQLVELMNGEISISSQRGQGSTFTFTIHVQTNKKPQETVVELHKSIEQTADYLEIHLEEPVITEPVFIYDSEENIVQRHSTLERLMLCIEMDNWQKAENFADGLKQLLAGGSSELNRLVFRMQMAVRKEDYDKSMECLNQMKPLIGLK